ncbi:putative AMID-like mitochondrial oxidoreductase [Amylocarpus encephaloides]|uniref:AMID-like mitochondrial oxidoreductase n=1 Tax=Amylocarpus encephaloides TaxID=45428 RepID=A0A9P8C5P6_9HELO|nr:putative AMID-like mitochondrial oxidoreductase [Amylocarpus encephaloides]
MAFELLRLVIKYFPIIATFSVDIVIQRLKAIQHLRTYNLLPDTQNVVVVGGSFAGLMLARRLAESLPSGYKVVLVERNSHFNYTFNFPRYSVVQGREQQAFIPYDGVAKGKPEGIFQQVKDNVTGIREGHVDLESGKSIPFTYLAIATGVTQTPPAKLLSTEKKESCAELRALQTRILESKTIAIVGAGAVGVQLAGDIRTFHQDKNVTLIQSREQLLPSFGFNLHVYVLKKLQDLGVEVILGQRPKVPYNSDWQSTELSLKHGTTRRFDLVIPCTGQTPNSLLLSSFSPSSISPRNNSILVKPTLQLQHNSKAAKDSSLPNVFALGDVAETGGPKMARAGMMHAEIVRANIVSLINGKGKLREYQTNALEGSLKLSLGKDDIVIWAQDPDGSEFLISGKNKNIDLEVKRAWGHFGAKYEDIKV